jgi:hypothetical protein
MNHGYCPYCLQYPKLHTENKNHSVCICKGLISKERRRGSSEHFTSITTTLIAVMPQPQERYIYIYIYIYIISPGGRWREQAAVNARVVIVTNRKETTYAVGCRDVITHPTRCATFKNVTRYIQLINYTKNADVYPKVSGLAA